ncbi:MAG: hypothetical protein QOF71_3027 [Candidatus Eremiobacteraeota bacterium]|jgi:hypothetical protein|nr:hypothetical protein [Candidatus Eremiobacteraeota bacterium]
MHPYDESALDQRLRRYYDAVPIPPRRAPTERAALPRLMWRRWVPAAAIAIAVVGGTAIAARDDLRDAAMRSIDQTLSREFKHPVREAKQLTVGIKTPAQLAEMGLELPRGLPSGAEIASMRAVNGDPGWLIVTYRVPGRAGDAIFSISSKRSSASGGNVALDGPGTVSAPTQFAQWETSAERVTLISRGAVFSAREIRAIKNASEGPK